MFLRAEDLIRSRGGAIDRETKRESKKICTNEKNVNIIN